MTISLIGQFLTWIFGVIALILGPVAVLHDHNNPNPKNPNYIWTVAMACMIVCGIGIALSFVK